MKRFSILLMLSALLVLSVLAACDCGDDDDECKPCQGDDADDDSDDDSADDDSDDDADDDTDDDSAEDLVQEGRLLLQAGIPEQARLKFVEAIEKDASISDAHYGALLGSALHLWEIVSLVSGYLYDWSQPPAQDGKNIDENREMIRQVIEALANGVFGPSGDCARENAAWLTQNGDPAFLIDNVPVIFMMEQAATLGTEFDVAEKHGSLAFGNLFDGLGGTLLSVKLDFNLQAVLSLSLSGDILEIINAIVDLLDGLLNDPGYPEFLMLDPDYMDLIAESRIYLGQGFTGVDAMLDAVRAETDAQADDVVSYEDLNGDGQYTEGEPITIPGIGALEGSDLEMLFAIGDALLDLGMAYLDRTPQDFRPGQPDPFHFSSLNGLLQALGLPPLIPGFLTLDIAATYENLQPDSIRDLLQTLVDILQAILPASAVGN